MARTIFGLAFGLTLLAIACASVLGIEDKPVDPDAGVGSGPLTDAPSSTGVPTEAGPEGSVIAEAGTDANLEAGPDSDVPCIGNRGACQPTSQCCIPGLFTCVNSICCIDKGVQCGNNTECCNGLWCTHGLNAKQDCEVCIEGGAPCFVNTGTGETVDDSCCSKTCNAGTCAD